MMDKHNKNAYFNWFDKVDKPEPNELELVERLVEENALLRKILMQKQQEGIETAVWLLNNEASFILIRCCGDMRVKHLADQNAEPKCIIQRVQMF